MKMTHLNDLLTHEMMDLHDAETQLLEALPKLADAASNPDLAEAFRNHLEETRNQIERLKKGLSTIDQEPNGETCEAMKGLIKEGNAILGSDAPSNIRDAALIVAAQKVEHYEIASYGSVRSLAQQLGLKELVDLMTETLEEEAATDELLTRLAEEKVNPKAMDS